MSPSGLPFRSTTQVLPACITNATNLGSCAEEHAARDEPEIGIVILVFAIGICFFIIASFRIGKTPDEVWIAYQNAVQEWRDEYREFLIEAIVGDFRPDETNADVGEEPADTASGPTPATSDEEHNSDRTRPSF